jgi:methionyl-tRNA synthetase
MLLFSTTALETFVTNADAELCGFKDPGNGVPLKKVTEESYFFKMSRYCEALIAHIETNPSFIAPEVHRNSILARLRKEGLIDLSISRHAILYSAIVI